MQPVKFVLVGCLNAMVGLSVIFLLKWRFGVGDTLANFAGYAAGLAFSFVLNGRWTFAFRGQLRGAAWKFCLVVTTAYLCNLSVVRLAISGVGVNSYFAQALGVLPYSLVSFLGFKYFTFRNGERAAR